MSSWNAGYISDIPYTFGYYPELNPLRIVLPFLRSGLRPPTIRTACELGIGHGVSTNIHAAASGVEWHGNDFNPSQAAFAGGLAQAAGSGARIYDDSFEEFNARDDLPQFDFIGIHGVWSWISDANRAQLVRFIQKRLRVGGVLYISYNSLPGWNYFAPMQQLMSDYAAATLGDAIDTLTRTNAGLDFIERFLATNPAIVKQIPSIPERFKALYEQNRHYVAHEYFNRNWRPMYFREIADHLTGIKLEFAGSAHYIDQIDAVNLSDEQLALLKEQPNWQWREIMRDFVTSQQFRRDYWVRGAEKLTQLEQQTALASHRIMLTAPAASIPLSVNGLRGKGGLAPEIYQPLIDLLSDYKPRSLGEIHTALGGRVSHSQLGEAVMILSGSYYAASTAKADDQDAAAVSSRNLNQRVVEFSRSRPDLVNLASPVIGGGVTADRFEQLFIEACWQGKQDAHALAEHAYGYLDIQAQRIVKDGKTLLGVEENRQELLTRAQAFLADRLAVMQALGIC